jgi:SHS2 domain-containing protein
MFGLMAEKKKSGLKKTVKIELEEDNLEELFVTWLNELLSLSAVKELIFSGFKIDKLGKNNLSARAEGSPVSNYKVHREIKAATYYELSLREIRTGWQAEVIFDV